MTALLAYARLALGVLLLGLVATVCWQSSRIHRWHEHYASEHAARLADRAIYEAAQVKATADNHAEVQRIERQSQRISDDTKSAYARDLAKLHRLRQQAAAAAQGAAGNSGTPKDGPAAIGTDANGLPVPSEDDVSAAAEIELRLMHLQNWVEEQLKN